MNPSIYIGLGGTGINAVSHTKKMFIDAYGAVENIPQSIAFLAIDFNSAEKKSKNRPASIAENFIELQDIGTSPQDLYIRNKGEFNWMEEKNANCLPVRADWKGAGQTRTTGRFLMEMVKTRISARIRACITQVAQLGNDNGGQVTIHIAMSLAGGTGSGSFINVAQLIRECAPNVPIHIVGYGVLHGVFRAMDTAGTKTPRVFANAYSAILDLDYFMNLGVDNPTNILLNGRNQELVGSPFDEFYVIDNKTENNQIVDHIDKISEVIGIAMFVSSMEVGEQVAGDQDNTGAQRADSNYNISDKNAWVQGLGACQVVYKGNELAEIYSLKAAINLVTKLQNITIDDVNKTTIDWAQTVQIKEDDGDDLLIDTIYDFKKNNINSVLIDRTYSIYEIKKKVGEYIEDRQNFPNKGFDKIKHIEYLQSLLRGKIEDLIKTTQSVANAQEFLSSLKRNIECYCNEMESERASLTKEIDLKQLALEGAYKEYEKYAKKSIFFKSKDTQESLLQDGIGGIAKEILKANLEVERRKIAVDIYKNLLEDVQGLDNKVKEINDKFSSLKDLYKQELAAKQNKNESVFLFEYDLSQGDRYKVEFTSDNDFYRSYFTVFKESSFLDVDIDRLDKGIRNYCETLPQANNYRNKLITDVIEELSDRNRNLLYEEVLNKSSRLLQLDDRGQLLSDGDLPTLKMNQKFLILIYNEAGKERTKTILESDMEKKKSDGKTVEFVVTNSDSMRQKIIFYRSYWAIIPYCIGAFDEYTVTNEYTKLISESSDSRSRRLNPHFDKQIFDKMQSSNFKLEPEKQDDQDNMLYWVCGQFFGWNVKEYQYFLKKNEKETAVVRIERKELVEHPKYICYRNGKYQVWNDNNTPDVVDGSKWESLGDNEQNRKRAYEYFKVQLKEKLKNSLHDKILADINAKGKDNYKILINGVINDGFDAYINKIACTSKHSGTYKDSANKEELDFFGKEWHFIEEELLRKIEDFK